VADEAGAMCVENTRSTTQTNFPAPEGLSPIPQHGGDEWKRFCGRRIEAPLGERPGRQSVRKYRLEKPRFWFYIPGALAKEPREL
jgi:hypothetical protein